MISAIFAVVGFVILYVLVIGIHGFGQYTALRMFGIHCQEFSIGFGPVLFKKMDKNETQWSFRVLPLGGLTKWDSEANKDLPWWKYVIICIAGGVFNIISIVIPLLFVGNLNDIAGLFSLFADLTAEIMDTLWRTITLHQEVVPAVQSLAGTSEPHNYPLWTYMLTFFFIFSYLTALLNLLPLAFLNGGHVIIRTLRPLEKLNANAFNIGVGLYAIFSILLMAWFMIASVIVAFT